MSKKELMEQVISIHNAFAEMFVSGGVVLKDLNCVVRMGEIVQNLRALATQLKMESDSEKKAEENTPETAT